jgi:hypothetical protein
MCDMSLTTRLARGELARWCAEHWADAEKLTADLQRRSRAAGQPEPVRRAGPPEPGQWTGIDAAFTVRLGLLAEGAAPAAALLGPVRAGLASPAWADQVAGMFGPSRLPAAITGRFSPYRRQVSDLPVPVGDVGEHEMVLTEFVTRVGRFLAEHAPPGRLGIPGAETVLARVCWVLAGWEHAFRTGRMPDQLAAVHAHPGYTVEDLRAAAPEPVVTELVELARVLHTSRTLAGWRRDAPGCPIATGPFGIANPVILPGWAEADLLLDSTLWEITTVTRLDDLDVLTRALWRLLACAWLDTRDVYGIRGLGIYLARHGVTMSWGLTAFCCTVFGGTGRDDDARDGFLPVARHLVRADGAEPPPPWVPRERILYGSH